jgi:hypothetical protein
LETHFATGSSALFGFIGGFNAMTDTILDPGHLEL